MRLFLAIDLPADVKKHIFTQLDPLRRLYPGFQWIPFDNYHVTIQFFGEEFAIDVIKKKVQEIIFDKEIFFLYSEGLEVFVNSKLVTYLYFKRSKQLEKIAEEINNNVKYIPHLRIARSRLSSKQQYFTLKKRLKKFSIETEFIVKKIILFQTIFTGTVPSYKPVATFPLLKKQK